MEAQVAAFADDIAYDAHDIDDGLRAGLFKVDDLKVVPLIAGIIAEIDAHYPALDDGRRRTLLHHLGQPVRVAEIAGHRRRGPERRRGARTARDT